MSAYSSIGRSGEEHIKEKLRFRSTHEWGARVDGGGVIRVPVRRS
jgi:hypothetical protein